MPEFLITLGKHYLLEGRNVANGVVLEWALFGPVMRFGACHFRAAPMIFSYSHYSP